MARMSMAFLVSTMILTCSAQLWTSGYPKLEFGPQMMSADAIFPQRFGSAVPRGGIPQDLIFRFKINNSGSANTIMENGARLSIKLSEFSGGDNTMWVNGSALISGYMVTASSQALTPADLFPQTGLLAQWESFSKTLTINFKRMVPAEEYAVVLSAMSFVKGLGPIPPPCLEKDAPIFLSEAVSAGVEMTGLLSRFGSVSSVGCFGKQSEARLGVANNSFVVAHIGQDSASNGAGMTQTLTVTIATNLDLSSIPGSIRSTITISGLVNSQTPDASDLQVFRKTGQALSIDGKFREPSQSAANTASWIQKTGTLKLTLNDGEIMPAGVPLIFSFKVCVCAHLLSCPYGQCERRCYAHALSQAFVTSIASSHSGIGHRMEFLHVFHVLSDHVPAFSYIMCHLCCVLAASTAQHRVAHFKRIHRSCDRLKCCDPKVSDE